MKIKKASPDSHLVSSVAAQAGHHRFRTELAGAAPCPVIFRRRVMRVGWAEWAAWLLLWAWARPSRPRRRPPRIRPVRAVRRRRDRRGRRPATPRLGLPRRSKRPAGRRVDRVRGPTVGSRSPPLATGLRALPVRPGQERALHRRRRPRRRHRCAVGWRFGPRQPTAGGRPTRPPRAGRSRLSAPRPQSAWCRRVRRWPPR